MPANVYPIAQNLVLNSDSVMCEWCYEDLMDDLARGAIQDDPGYLLMGRTTLPCGSCNFPLTDRE